MRSCSERLPGWKRSRGGPRRTWVLLTSRRLLWIESRLFRNSKAQSLDYSEIALARHRNMILFSRAEFLTQRHENFTLTVAQRSYQVRGDGSADDFTPRRSGYRDPSNNPPGCPAACNASSVVFLRLRSWNPSVEERVHACGQRGRIFQMGLLGSKGIGSIPKNSSTGKIGT